MRWQRIPWTPTYPDRYFSRALQAPPSRHGQPSTDGFDFATGRAPMSLAEQASQPCAPFVGGGVGTTRRWGGQVVTCWIAAADCLTIVCSYLLVSTFHSAGTQWHEVATHFLLAAAV